MTKREFAKLYIKNSSKTMTIAEGIKEIEDILDIIGTVLKEKGKISFPNHCTIDVIDRAERRIADPNTKEPMIIKPPKKVRFKLAHRILEKMNN